MVMMRTVAVPPLLLVITGKDLVRMPGRILRIISVYTTQATVTCHASTRILLPFNRLKLSVQNPPWRQLSVVDIPIARSITSTFNLTTYFSDNSIQPQPDSSLPERYGSQHVAQYSQRPQRGPLTRFRTSELILSLSQ